MLLWEKAKERYCSLSKGDFIYLSCPNILKIAEAPDYCPLSSNEINIDLCEKCWERDVEEGL